MSELEVRIVTLEPMRVASAHGFGEQPEEQAWTPRFGVIVFWAKVSIHAYSL